MTSLSYNRGNDLIEIKIKDSTGKTIEKFKTSTSDKALCSRILSHIKEKYGLKYSPEVPSDESINCFKEEGDYNWFSMDNNFFK